MSFWRTRTFHRTNKFWEEKLFESGFIDAEIEVKGERLLKQKATNSYRQASQLERETRQEYYSFLGHLAHNTDFPNELERIVMGKHAEGSTIKEIVEEINRHGIKRDRKTIRYIIRRYQVKWGVKSWTLAERNLKR